MKETLLQFARYNVWANKRIIEAMLKLDEELFDKEVVSSFSSIRKTVLHVWGAESIWLQRLELKEQPVWIADSFDGSFTEACNEWQKASEALLQFVEKQFDDRAFEHVFQYYNLKKQSFKNPVYATLLHVCNHGTYHRGQLITMIRQLGATKIPETDFIVFVRLKG
jgi:uncharacterized damage-inducible protein DinB